VYVDSLTLEDLAELEPAENMTDVALGWNNGPTIDDVIPILKRWRQLRRLTFPDCNETKMKTKKPVRLIERLIEVLSDFIMEMEHLSHLHIAPNYDRSNCDQLKILRDKVNEFILPRRPNFKFDI
jgi:hypothetical protein